MIGTFYLNGGGQAAGANAGVTPPAPSQPAAANPPAQPDAAIPPASPPSPPQALPAPLTDERSPDLWLVVLNQAQTFSPDMEPAAVATSGQWYRVLRMEDDWVLGVWEFDPPDSLVWIPLGPDVALTNS